MHEKHVSKTKQANAMTTCSLITIQVKTVRMAIMAIPPSCSFTITFAAYDDLGLQVTCSRFLAAGLFYIDRMARAQGDMVAGASVAIMHMGHHK
ncbi:hypothetical protein [Komagataeibacter sp. NFXK3]